MMRRKHGPVIGAAMGRLKRIIFLNLALMAGLTKFGYADVFDIQTQPKMYWAMDYGWREISNSDAYKFLDYSGLGYAKPNIPAIGMDPVFDLGLGYQFSSHFDLELGGSVGPGMDFNETLQYGSRTNGVVSAGWSSCGLHVMPAFNFWSPGFWGNPCYQTLGVRIGPSFLFGSNGYLGYDGSGPIGFPPPNAGEPQLPGSTRDFNDSAWGLDVGLVYRIQYLFGGALGTGLELALDYMDFPRVEGSLTGGGTTQVNPDGSPLSINETGLSLKFVFGSWFGHPVRDPLPRDLGKGIQSYQAGRSLLEAKRYPAAEEQLELSVQYDPNSAATWRALGDTFYYLNDRKSALNAYDRALALVPDAALAAFVQKLK